MDGWLEMDQEERIKSMQAHVYLERGGGNGRLDEVGRVRQQGLFG